MTEFVVIDEVRLTVRSPAGLTEEDAEVVRRTLAGNDFLARLRRRVRAAVRSFPELAEARISLAR